MTYSAALHCPTEWGFTSARLYADPFNQVELDVVVTGPDGAEWRVPAYWAGGQSWRVRFAGPARGVYQWRTVCSDAGNPDLHGVAGTLDVGPYEGANPLYRHGPLHTAASGRTFAHADGTPFFWLGDTWWHGVTKRLAWPGDFQTLTADRAAKGFDVIQLFAAFFPDLAPFDDRAANEAGFPWDEGFTRINPAYFDMLDLRVDWLVRAGLVPCIFCAQGYAMEWLGVEQMKQHCRYLAARFAAYPVVWCMGGEIDAAWYLHPFASDDERRAFMGHLRAQWNDVAAYMREIDPFRRPLTAHPCTPRSARDTLDDDLMTYDMVQTGHSGARDLGQTVQAVVRSYDKTPPKPAINGEVSYEGMHGGSWQDTQRLFFWVCVLSGAAGHSYGAQGVWQVNRRGQPFGNSPYGRSWGHTPWDEAMHLPGSTQMGVGKAILERYRWWEFVPHPEWVAPRWADGDYLRAYAAGIPGRVRVCYAPVGARIREMRELEPGVRYRAAFVSPFDGAECAIGEVTGDENGAWPVPLPPVSHDWVIILETAGARLAAAERPSS